MIKTQSEKTHAQKFLKKLTETYTSKKLIKRNLLKILGVNRNLLF